MPIKGTKKNSARGISVLSKADRDAMDKLVKNNVELQKICLNLVESTYKLTDKISGLIGLFEEAAKNVGVVDEFKIREETSNLSQRLDQLLQQNRDLAKGLLLLEQYVRNRTLESPRSFSPKPLPRQ